MVVASLCIMLAVHSLDVIDMTERGVRVRFGRFSASVLDAGMQWTLPRPFGSIETVPVGAMVVLPFMEPVKAEANVSTENARALSTVIDGGAESVVIRGCARLAYQRERNAMIRYLTTVRDPLGLIDHLARRAITQAASSASLDQLMDHEASDLAAKIQRQLKEECEKLSLGMEVISVEVHGIHPPGEVNEAYADVINAKIDADRMVAEARGFAEMERQRSQMMRDSAIADAHVASKKRWSQVFDESTRFSNWGPLVRNNRRLLRHWLEAETLAAALESKPLILLDALLPAETGVSFVQSGAGGMQP